ncbi:MAG TPA: hypothetical protein VJT09_10755 [Pyrinomonadaceae bacterium]|nr:hypothetical protein [Pyrinomonadaceae bacterium]
MLDVGKADIWYLASSIWHLLLETDHFINEGFGWVCKHCSRDREARVSDRATRARFFTEGEAEEKEPTLSTPALARWTTPARRALACPRCRIEETVDKR